MPGPVRVLPYSSAICKLDRAYIKSPIAIRPPIPEEIRGRGRNAKGESRRPAGNNIPGARDVRHRTIVSRRTQGTQRVIAERESAAIISVQAPR